MVLLTITPTILQALTKLQSLPEKPSEELVAKISGTAQHPRATNEKEVASAEDYRGKDSANATIDNEQSQNRDVSGKRRLTKQSAVEPSLSDPKLGNPISHGQIIDLSKALKCLEAEPSALDTLLRGSKVYVPPPKPKPEPTAEYKALMARLRHEEDERSYQRMINPPPPMETFAERFPLSSAAHAFASAPRPLDNEVDDEITYSDVDRQIALIFNVLISIFACAAAIWIVAKWWSTPMRLALSFSGSMLVGIAEVVVYLGYVRRVGEAKGKEKAIKEVKEVVRTWVVGGTEEDGDNSAPIKVEEESFSNVRRRKIEVG